MRSLAVILALVCGPALAHEFWIEPLNYRVEADGKLEGRLVNGERFEGVNLPYLPRNFQMFTQFGGGDARPVEGRLGDSPALSAAPLNDGLQVVAYVSTVSRLEYTEFEKFQRFADHKAFANIPADHSARGLPETDFGEAYTRFAKTLIAAGDGTGSDFRVGLETEIVALANPYTDDVSGGLPVQVWYGDEPRADAQVELFDKAPDGTVEITLHRTDAEGIAVLPVVPGHSYLVDAVILREPAPALAEGANVVWETLWASMTFAVPE